MSEPKESMFRPDANATPVSEIKQQAPDPRRARVTKVHKEIAAAVKDGSIYRPRPR